MSKQPCNSCTEADELLASFSDGQLLHFAGHVKDELSKRFPEFKAVGDALREAPRDGAVGKAMASVTVMTERVVSGRTMQ